MIQPVSPSSHRLARALYRLLALFFNAYHLAFFILTCYLNIQVQLTYLLHSLPHSLLLRLPIELLSTALLIFLVIAYLRSVYYLSIPIQAQHYSSLSEQLHIYCDYCQKQKSSSTRHCFYCNRCVLGYRQHCFLFNNCVTDSSYPHLLSLSLSGLCWYGLSLCLDLIHLSHLFTNTFQMAHLKVYAGLIISLLCTLAMWLLCLCFLVYNYFLVLNNLRAVEHSYGKYEGKCNIYSGVELGRAVLGGQAAKVWRQFRLNYREVVGPMTIKHAFMPE